MTLAWLQRHEELLRDCIVSPDVFTSMVDRLGEFVMPYQQALETAAAQRNVHLYLPGLLSFATQECRGHRGVGRCRTPGPARVHRHGALGSSPVDPGAGRPSDRAAGGTRGRDRL